jgi:NADH dehydrogenase
LYAARALRNAPVDVTLVDRRNFHLFQPLLYQVATGVLSANEIATPLRLILHKQRNIRIVLGEGLDVDVENRQLIISGNETLPYDTLVIATGARSSYFGHPEWAQIAPGLKTVEDAEAMRRKIFSAFEAAEREPDPQRRRAWLTFVVIGGGATGVELAGALAGIANVTLRHDFEKIHPEESQILLLDASPRVLSTYDEVLSASAENQLIRLGVRSRTGVKVTGVDQDGVTLESPAGEERIATHTVLWAAGVAPSPFGEILAKKAGAALDRAGHIQVASDLSLPNHPEIFVVGDLARLEQNGKPLAGVAPVAIQQGRYAASVIHDRIRGRTTKPFHYFDKGMLAVIGRNSGIGTIGKFRLTGWLAWMAWLFIHLFYLTEALNRVLVFLRWGYEYSTFARGAMLITGQDDTASGTAANADLEKQKSQTAK